MNSTPSFQARTSPLRHGASRSLRVGLSLVTLALTPLLAQASTTAADDSFASQAARDDRVSLVSGSAFRPSFEALASAQGGPAAGQPVWRDGDGHRGPSEAWVSPSAVPEPGSYAMFLIGLMAIGFVARRRAP